MKLVITMSRRYGTGASVIAEELSKRLGIPVYDKVNVEQELSRNTYESEVEAIKGLAQKPCIILGRCASEILKDRLNVFNIYVCADKEDRIEPVSYTHLDVYKRQVIDCYSVRENTWLSHNSFLHSCLLYTSKRSERRKRVEKNVRKRTGCGAESKTSREYRRA